MLLVNLDISVKGHNKGQTKAMTVQTQVPRPVPPRKQSADPGATHGHLKGRSPRRRPSARGGAGRGDSGLPLSSGCRDANHTPHAVEQLGSVAQCSQSVRHLTASHRPQCHPSACASVPSSPDGGRTLWPWLSSCLDHRIGLVTGLLSCLDWCRRLLPRPPAPSTCSQSSPHSS